MTPFYFGSRERRLFGVYHPAQGGGGSRAVVMCYPWGYEYVNAHRSLVKLASLLSQEGYHVLRFDYFGTGDSAGEDHEMTLQGSLSDISMAIEELKDLSGADHVSVIGLRVGAALAAQAARKWPDDISSLVLWDPILKGAEYLQELYLLDDSMRIPGVGPAAQFSPERGGGREVMGFPVTDALASEFSGLDVVSTISELKLPVFMVAIRPVPGQADVAYELSSRDGSGFELIDDQPVWHEEWPDNVGVIPVTVLNRIVSWMN
ncbi:alpha/beta fold hydrolase [Hyphomonas pacifica]|uniref:Serine aminopeptidase S33 domain-containing protein n=1 Tax=Hyphomonas pacifica TaxID=1280941 RepID=A0A062TUC6_9PROT|nr:alpha/beta fold hydrolase [Hyphomonas pacifica]KCZ51586.1 hypothetical protein HY2_01140 [Hyphomonas pacifica]RAN34255.1 hypothetical protein HY3_01225 [Hyphomonas pacifica]